AEVARGRIRGRTRPDVSRGDARDEWRSADHADPSAAIPDPRSRVLGRLSDVRRARRGNDQRVQVALELDEGAVRLDTAGRSGVSAIECVTNRFQGADSRLLF